MDASVLVEWLLPGVRQEQAALLFEDPELDLVAPDLILLEAANAFRTTWRAGIVSSDDLGIALSDLAEIPIETVGTRTLLDGVAALSPELTAYDACYLALAILRNVPLATFDRQLAEVAAARGVAQSP